MLRVVVSAHGIKTKRNIRKKLKTKPGRSEETVRAIVREDCPGRT